MLKRNYGPTIKSGDIRDRSWRVTIENPLSIDPEVLPKRNIIIHEEKVIRLKDNTERVIQRCASLSATDESLDDDETIDLYNPITHEVIGQATIGVCKAHVYSLLHSIQLKRDAKEDLEAKEQEAKEQEAKEQEAKEQETEEQEAEEV